VSKHFALYENGMLWLLLFSSFISTSLDVAFRRGLDFPLQRQVLVICKLISINRLGSWRPRPETIDTRVDWKELSGAAVQSSISYFYRLFLVHRLQLLDVSLTALLATNTTAGYSVAYMWNARTCLGSREVIPRIRWNSSTSFIRLFLARMSTLDGRK